MVRALTRIGVLLAVFALGARTGGFGYARRAHAPRALNCRDAELAGNARQAIQSACPDSGPLPRLTPTQRAALHRQVVILADVVDRNPHYRYDWSGAITGSHPVGWAPELQEDLLEL